MNFNDMYFYEKYVKRKHNEPPRGVTYFVLHEDVSDGFENFKAGTLIAEVRVPNNLVAKMFVNDYSDNKRCEVFYKNRKTAVRRKVNNINDVYVAIAEFVNECDRNLYNENIVPMEIQRVRYIDKIEDKQKKNRNVEREV